jgi:uncharacterized protein
MELIPPFGAEDRQAATMADKKTRLQIVARGQKVAVQQTDSRKRHQTDTVKSSGPPLVSGRWLLAALGLSIAAAALCAWGVLCLLFWQGSWQLLYHPKSAVTHTPADVGLNYEQVEFATTDAGVPQLKGWLIPAADGASYRRFTVVYMHGQDGNLGDTVGPLARLHSIGLNILAFDYRGYGQSQFVRPNEANLRADANSALQYLIQTRHVNPAAIVLYGTGLGANLAFEVAAQHASLAGVVVDSPENEPMAAVFNDARARLVPAHLLNHDRYDLSSAAGDLRIPVLWLMRQETGGQISETKEPAAYQRVASHKMLVWLNGPGNANNQYTAALSRWLDSL